MNMIKFTRELPRARYRSGISSAITRNIGLSQANTKGKLVRSSWTVAEAKNVGKANETTPVEQALSEIESKYEKKLSREYHKSIDDIDKKRYVKPMRAFEFKNIELDWSRPHVIQPKLDGVRCVIDKYGMKSREGKPILGAPHIHHLP